MEKFDYKDINIVPAVLSDIETRHHCNPYTFGCDKVMLPLFAAPMDTVVSMDNYTTFLYNEIMPCIPRALSTDRKNFGELKKHKASIFLSFGMSNDDFDIMEEYIKLCNDKCNVLIDVANGHMKKLVRLTQTLKLQYPDVKVMIGNIANPDTLLEYGLVKADFIRVGIGAGNACTTSANVGIHYPMASLIKECYEVKMRHNLDIKIVADGGIRNFDDAIKALSLGADFVMIGSLFNQCIESAGKNYFNGINVGRRLGSWLYDHGFNIHKMYRGMSTKGAQRSMGKSILKTSEGITKKQLVKYRLGDWVDDFESYLRSAMSYTNAPSLSLFIGKPRVVRITGLARSRFEK